MIKSEWKAAIALTSATLTPWVIQADVSQDSQTPNYVPGESLHRGDLSGGYNQTAAYSCRDPWELFLTGDYIYWNWQQELIPVGTLMSPTATGFQSVFNGTGEVLLHTPGYESGFQLGLGCNLRGMDDWSVYSNYTWYKNTSSQTNTASDSEILAVSPALLQHVQGATIGVLLAGELYTTARVTYNAVDLLLQRPFYWGRKVRSNFMAGVQALWISQKFTAAGYDLSFIGEASVVADVLRGSFQSKFLQKSWGLGPKFGLGTDWLLGQGLKIFGNTSFSLLYTSYIKLSSDVSGVVSNIDLANLQISQTDNYNTVNPVAEMSLGLGWGSYFYDRNLHFDLLVGYEFKMFWNQNVLYTLINTNGSPGSMSFRGLNVQLRFDF